MHVIIIQLQRIIMLILLTAADTEELVRRADGSENNRTFLQHARCGTCLDLPGIPDLLLLRSVQRTYQSRVWLVLVCKSSINRLLNKKKHKNLKNWY